MFNINQLPVGALFKVSGAWADLYYRKTAQHKAVRIFRRLKDGTIETQYRGVSCNIADDTDSHFGLTETEAFEVALLDATLPAGESDQ